jgi:signal transduction histidine kinase
MGVSHRWVFAFTVAALYGAAVLRSVLAFDGTQRLVVLVLLAAWLVLLLVEPALTARWAGSFAVLVAAQAFVVAALLVQSDSSDFFAILLAVSGMQAVQRWGPRATAWLIAAFALLTGLCLVGNYGVEGALPLVVTYAGASGFLAVYAWAEQRAAQARSGNEALAADLRAANRRLARSAAQAERLGAARERQRLARDLHDSVTQTLFSMTLTARSAGLLLEKRPGELGAQLDHLDELTRTALTELDELGAELPPPAGAGGGLAGVLRRCCEERGRRDGLEVGFVLDDGGERDEGGEEDAPPEVEQALLRITQEALHNVVKHAGVGRAVVRLRPRRPIRLEIRDDGAGFDTGVRDAAAVAASGEGLGLPSMRERAAELGFRLTVTSAPGQGTTVLLEEPDEEGAGDG